MAGASPYPPRQHARGYESSSLYNENQHLDNHHHAHPESFQSYGRSVMSFRGPEDRRMADKVDALYCLKNQKLQRGQEANEAFKANFEEIKVLLTQYNQCYSAQKMEMTAENCEDMSSNECYVYIKAKLEGLPGNQHAVETGKNR